MRDIVSSNGFSASTLQTKTKVAKMPPNNNSSGTLTRADYRSYRDFLGSYGDNKNVKDDQESVSSTESGISSYNLSESKSNNTSTSSLNSETNGSCSKNSPKTEPNLGVGSRTGSFRNYLESYNHKKFSSVRAVPSKQNSVKSEIVIQVNDPLEQQHLKNEPAFVMTTINGDDTTDCVPPPPKFAPPKLLNGNQKKFSYLPPPPPPPTFVQSPKEEEHDVNDYFPPPPPPLINNGHQDNCGSIPPPPPPPPKLPDFNKPSTEAKKWGAVEVDGHCSKPKAQSENHLANHAAATNLAKILTQHLLPRRKELESRLNEQESHKSAPVSPPSKAKNLETSKLPQNEESQNYTCVISHVPVIPVPPKFLKSPSPSQIPPPPPPKMDYCTLPRKPHKVMVELAPALPRSPPPKFETNNVSKMIDAWAPKLPASPPPKVEAYIVPKQPQKMTATVELSSPKWSQNSSPVGTNGRNSPCGSVDFNTTTVVPINDASTKVSKNDPNVRKLVYNTYRGFLGAYNNKANDMIATLPRSRVREDQGVSKQLESIALQGGLEKLNGRTNPKVEDEGRNQ